jgi:hypothetical protein
MTLYCKKLGAIIISENLPLTSRNKHFDFHHHSIGELTEKKTVTYVHVITKKQVGDISFKGLNTSHIVELRAN